MIDLNITWLMIYLWSSGMISNIWMRTMETNISSNIPLQVITSMLWKNTTSNGLQNKMIWCLIQMTGMISGMDTILQELIQKLTSELHPTIFTPQANCFLKNYLTKQWLLIKLSKFWKQTNIYLISWESISTMMPLVELPSKQ